MAGDLDIDEHVIILEAPPEGMDAALGAAPEPEVQLAGLGARVIHRFGPRVVITEVAEAAAEDVQQAAGGDVAAAAVAARRVDLDDIGTMGLEALALRSSDDYSAAKAARPLAGEEWSTEQASHPDATDEDGDSAAVLAPGPAGPTSAYLVGSVAVGVVIVEGSTDDLKFSSAERIKVVAEVQNGLSWLATLDVRANVSFTYDIQVVSLDVSPGSDSLGFVAKETLWRDPALAQMGFGPGMPGCTAYVNDMRSRFGTRWGYCAFFTKYPVGHFAYASLGGPRLVMHYDNDGWGPDNIDRVFTHETGHIFNAPDEYAKSGCSCGGSWGRYGEANRNCENCAPGGGVPCLMKSNTWAICDWTPLHLGWPRGWFPLSGDVRQPDVATNTDGRLEVFAVGSDDALWHIWQTAPNNGWSNWRSLGGQISEVRTGRNADGRLEIFAVGSDQAMWHIWQTAPDNGWSGWHSLGGNVRQPDVATNADGRLEVFAVGSDDALWHTWQTAPDNGWA